MNRIQPAISAMMVRPASFGFNPQTASSNAFQETPSGDAPVAKLALQEFDALVAILRQENVQVLVIDDEKRPPKPDAVFCNNWISFHHDGSIILYPMMAPNRRHERRGDIINEISDAGFLVKRVIDYSGYEKEGKFLESTGSMAIDHESGIVYACLSPRTHPDILSIAAAELGMDLIKFNAVDRDGQAIYHTNVVMTIGDRFSVICAESIKDLRERKKVIDKLVRTHHEIVEISYDQLYAFAGNMLQVADRDGEKLLVMSDTAYHSLNLRQIQTLQKYNRIVKAPIPTIETLGGGSVRCMIADIHLPNKPTG